MKWKLLNENLLDDFADLIDMTTTESHEAMRATFPDEVIAFHERLQREKEEKINMKTEARKAVGKSKGKCDTILEPCHLTLRHNSLKSFRDWQES